jgi:ABC-type glutathione transport system ATPase component
VRSSNTNTSTNLLTSNKKESSAEPTTISTDSKYSSVGNTKKPLVSKLPSSDMKYSKSKSRTTNGGNEDMVQRPTILLKASSTPTNKNEQENGSNQNTSGREQNPKHTSLLSEHQLNNSIPVNPNKRIVVSGIELKKPSSPASGYNLLQQFNQTPQVVAVNKSLVENSTSTNVSSPSLSFIESLSSRLTNNLPAMNKSITLLDESLQWSDALQDFLLDQNEFLVVGILGKHGVGKSTIMSQLAGSSYSYINRFCPFKSSPKETLELAHHETNGIQAFITQERTILLDVQV